MERVEHMKKIITAFLAVAVALTTAGCSKASTKSEEVQDAGVQAKAVKVQKLEESRKAVTLNYIGTVASKELVKYSFKVPGQIGKIHVAKGDPVKRGDRLAELDAKDLQFQVSAAKSTMDIAGLNIKKAEDSLNYVSSLYEKVNNLYVKGSVSKNQYEQVQLQKAVSESEYSQAKSQYDAARTDYDYKSDLLENSVLYAEQDGFVVEKVFNENERVGAYMPVVIVRSGVQVVNVGIPQQELSKVGTGSKAIVDVDGEKAEGTVTNVSEAPDETTRTYTGEISVSGKTFRLGSIAKVSVDAGTQNGIWIPMSSVLSGGENYIYVIKDNRAFKRTVEIQKISGDQLLVTGVMEGELLTVSGMKNLNDGSTVNVEE